MSKTAYQEFLASKAHDFHGSGKNISPTDINPMLFPFQRDVTAWAVRKGRAAVFLDTGMGKSFVQIEWSRLLGERTLIVAPLSVARQTIREARKIDVDIRYVRHPDECNGNQIVITNYEMVDKFNPDAFGAVVLDESSIIKSFDGKTKKTLLNMFQKTPYRLCCTATPAPNDQAELGNHAEFLGICKLNEMLSMYFIHANKIREQVFGDMIIRTKESNTKGQEWRLKFNAQQAFYRWLSSWAISLRKPSDLGYEDDGFILPPLKIIPHFFEIDYKSKDQLFFTGLHGITDRLDVRRNLRAKRIEEVKEVVKNDSGQWILWCGLNEESTALTRAFPDSIEIKGTDSPEEKSRYIEEFQDGKHRVLVTKGKISGFGLNLQNAHNMAFIGMSDSFELYYQCVRRCWRFGQGKPVNVHIILANIEREILNNVLQKEAIAKRMTDELIAHVKGYEIEEIGNREHKRTESREETVMGNNFTAMLGDSCIRLKEIAENSIDLSVYSPPFADLFTYTDLQQDLGNSRDWGEFFNHYAFIISELLRVTKSGRMTCVHTADIPAMAVKDGYIGMKDFPGEVIRSYEKAGWVFSGRAIVGKNPQAQAIRTKAKALLFVQLGKDSSDSRPAILDQILIFKKPGENAVPVRPVENGEIDNEKWIDWAGGIWTGIRETDTLQYSHARDKDDEKHIAPLQLGTVERCIKLYSNPGETILTPFLGIGTEAYQAIRFGRKAIGIELKESYFRVAVKNLENISREVGQGKLFDIEPITVALPSGDEE